MSQAIVDPEELRDFAGHLRRFTEDLEKRRAGLRRKFEHLNDTWRDDKQREFADVFEDAMRHIDRFVERSEDHIPYLRKKADEVDTYLGR